MSDEITVRFPATILETLRCFICRGYLSCSPVLLLPNGNYICGRCAPLNMDTPTQRMILLESFLSSISFPCVFKEHGCQELLLFGKTADHVLMCVYKPFGCPTKTSTTCAWEGTSLQLLQHFKEDHPDCIKEKIEFQLELTKDAQGFLMLSENSIPFVVKYLYNAKESMLKYDVRYCGSKREVSRQLQLINSTDSECSINLKMNECLSYDESFGDVRNGNVLDINKFIENLGNPDSIVIAVNFSVTKLNCSDAIVDCLDKLKCNKCWEYLLPPLFDLNGKVICGDCFKNNPNSKPCDDPNLLELINEAMYPCPWRECNYIGKSNIFKKHMINCKFRICHCVYSNCEVTFQFAAAADHLKTHEKKNTVLYMPNKITYQTSFAQGYQLKSILSIINDTLILFNYLMKTSNSERFHQIAILRARDNPNDISAIATFEHMHCKRTKKIELKKSAFGVQVQVPRRELPYCFQEMDDLTVTVDIIV